VSHLQDLSLLDQAAGVADGSIDPSELLRATLELAFPLLRYEKLAHQVLEGEQHDGEERDRRQTEDFVTVGDPQRE